ncbi:hypothetical protein DES44_3736 [Roseateles depolymerans]|uniref:Uncharacterized protein n=1 Tax=Roseateles depolymerans TaxID=76731 RepID=A0A0U3LIR6_9BURK|nr:hypothetical protein RD2015_256 [Roseateles depolymerans]REG15230.1 hypothetical protein DES44_3736 [Roseateles depolymerans]
MAQALTLTYNRVAPRLSFEGPTLGGQAWIAP